MDDEKQKRVTVAAERLSRALDAQAAACHSAAGILRDGGSDQAARDVREAAELVRCLRRLLAGRTVEEIHRAFGAPGDFGYETPIGDALARVYGVRS